MNHYYLAHYEWVSDIVLDGLVEIDHGMWQPPFKSDCLSVVNLRGINDGHSRAVPKGYGFFCYAEQKNIQNSIYLGQGLDTQITPQIRNDIQTALDINGLAIDTIREVLFDILTVHADETGEKMCKPIMPTKLGISELHLKNHSLIKSEKINPGVGKRGKKLLKLLHQEYKQAKGKGKNGENHRRNLWIWQKKYGGDAKRFIPKGHKEESPIIPRTPQSEDFESGYTDGNEIVDSGFWTSPNSSWGPGRSENANGNTGWCGEMGGTYANGTATNNTGGYRVRQESAYWDTALSGADHYSQMDGYISGGRGFGPCTRMNTSDDKYYLGRVRRDLSEIQIIYRDGSSDTGLGTAVSKTITNQTWYEVKLESDGSTHKLYFDGVLEATETDTNLSTETNCGVWGYQWGLFDVIRWDNWEADTLSSDPTLTPSALSIASSVQAPTISIVQSVTVTPSALSLAASLPAPTVDTDENITVTPSSLSISSSVQAPSISADCIVTPSALPIASSISTPTIDNGAGATDYTQDSDCIFALTMKNDESPVDDVSSNSHTGALDSAGNPDYSTDAPDGYNAGSYDFTADKLLISDHADLSPQAGSSGLLSIGCWIKPSSLQTGNGNRQWIMTKGSGSNYEYAINLVGDGTNVQLRGSIWQSNGNAVMEADGSTNISADIWTHVAMTFDRASEVLKIYVNGVEDAEDTSASGNSSAGSEDVLIGERGDGGNYVFAGKITEAFLMGRELGSSEVLEIKNNGLDGTQGSGDVTISLASLSISSSISSPIPAGTLGLSSQSLSTSVQSPLPEIALSPSSQSISSSLNEPVVDIEVNVTITPSAFSIGSSVLSPSIDVSGNKTITPDPLTITASLPSITKDVTIAPSSLSISSSVAAPSVSTGNNITVTPNAFSIDSSVLSPSLNLDCLVSPDSLLINSVLEVPSISTEGNLTVAVSPLYIAASVQIIYPNLLLELNSQSISSSLINPGYALLITPSALETLVDLKQVFPTTGAFLKLTITNESFANPSFTNEGLANPGYTQEALE